AVLSALNSGLFAASRMLMALARRRDAPALTAKLDTRGVPLAAILASTAFGYLTVAMSYLSPDRIFAFLVNSYGTVGARASASRAMNTTRSPLLRPAPAPGSH
ncbi:MAG: GABA permease, partial [Gammaproteobacteria bacterium]